MTWIALLAILAFPIVAVRHAPFGGGGRYLSVLAGPLMLLCVLWLRRGDLRATAQHWWRFTRPWWPWALVILLVSWPDYTTLVTTDPVGRVAWSGVLAVAALAFGLRRSMVIDAAALGGLIYASIVSVEWVVGGNPRPGAGINPIPFGQIAIIGGGICLLAAAGAVPAVRRRRTLWVVGGAASLLAALIAGSRGPMLAVPVLIAALAAMTAASHPRFGRGASKHVSPMAIASWVVIAGLLLATAYASGLTERFGEALSDLRHASTLSAGVNSVSVRLELWSMAMHIGVQLPWTGIGFGPLSAFTEQLPHLTRFNPELLVALQHFHSDMFDMLARGGVPLLVAWVVTLTWAAVASRRDPLRLWILAGVVVCGLTDMAFMSKLTLTYALSVWMILAGSEAHGVPHANPSSDGQSR